MPRRQDLKSILLIGSGPIVIGQACEFDYSGTQSQSLREEGYRVVLLNSNPATIMTDPEFADATYIEPITPETVERIIEKERPCAILPTLGGQTALNTAMALHHSGALERLGVGCSAPRLSRFTKLKTRAFKEAMVHRDQPGSLDPRGQRGDLDPGALRGGHPLHLATELTMGGEGGGTVNSEADYEPMVRRAMELSPVGSVLVEESLDRLERVRTRGDP